MSTNYYRIPTVDELEQSRSKLLKEFIFVKQQDFVKYE